MKEEVYHYLKACQRTVEFLNMLENSLNSVFPLKGYSYIGLEEEALIDALIYRSAKLQELLGKLLRAFLKEKGYNVDSMYPIDMVNLVEKLNLIELAKEWFELREMRKAVNHDYTLMELTKG